WMRGAIPLLQLTTHVAISGSRRMVTHFLSVPAPIRAEEIVRGGRGISGTCSVTICLRTGGMPLIGSSLLIAQGCHWGQGRVLEQSPSFHGLMVSGPLRKLVMWPLLLL